MSAANKGKDDTIYKHFHSDEHQGLRDIEVNLIDKVNEKDNQEFLEWINQYHDTIKFTWDWSRKNVNYLDVQVINCLLYTSPSPRDGLLSRMPSSA